MIGVFTGGNRDRGVVGQGGRGRVMVVKERGRVGVMLLPNLVGQVRREGVSKELRVRVAGVGSVGKGGRAGGGARVIGSKPSVRGKFVIVVLRGRRVRERGRGGGPRGRGTMTLARIQG